MTAEPAIPESGPRRHGVRLTPLQVPKSSDVLADDLRERILRGDFPEGTALPTERELVSQTRMSRATVREALRILEVQGLVRIKTGRAGGIRHDCAPSPRSCLSRRLRDRTGGRSGSIARSKSLSGRGRSGPMGGEPASISA